MIKPPYYPIVYVRGYAGTQTAVESTVATPYMGFNLGATKYRQTQTGDVQPYVFESPLIRLMKDHDYVDAYHDGQIKPEGPVDSRSIWIFRYYDAVSEDLGSGERKEIEFHAEQLQKFLLHIKKAIGMENDDSFKVYLVAHSMGGLVCRCYMQNENIPDLSGKVKADNSKKGVAKLFTYATPHRGIDLRRGLGWAEGLADFLDINNSGNFGPQRMREILNLPLNVPLHSLNGQFPPERVFSLIGTDAKDYNTARTVVGPQSDGLVQIKNAYAQGSSRAYVYRSHSGQYGIVNSESGYQNLERFLFGNARVAVALKKVNIALPRSNGDTITATYNIENVVAVRKLLIPINKRTTDTYSATFRSQEELAEQTTHLFTVFLKKPLATRRRSLGFSIHFRIVPQYHKQIRFWPDQHYTGQAVFDDRLIIEVTPSSDNTHRARYNWGSRSMNATIPLNLVSDGKGALTAQIPLKQTRPLKISGDIVFDVTPWS
jgi:hypothetical protein